MKNNLNFFLLFINKFQNNLGQFLKNQKIPRLCRPLQGKNKIPGLSRNFQGSGHHENKEITHVHSASFEMLCFFILIFSWLSPAFHWKFGQLPVPGNAWPSAAKNSGFNFCFLHIYKHSKITLIYPILLEKFLVKRGCKLICQDQEFA